MDCVMCFTYTHIVRALYDVFLAILGCSSGFCVSKLCLRICSSVLLVGDSLIEQTAADGSFESIIFNHEAFCSFVPW